MKAEMIKDIAGGKLVGKAYETTVMGKAFVYFSDFIMRGTVAVNVETGESKKIHGNGYINKDLTARKAIAKAFGFQSFRA